MSVFLLVPLPKILGFDQLEVGPLSIDQLVVGALFHNAASRHDHDIICVPDRREPVGDERSEGGKVTVEVEVELASQRYKQGTKRKAERKAD